MQQVLKDLWSLKGLVLLIALVALGLSIAAVVKGPCDKFGNLNLCQLYSEDTGKPLEDKNGICNNSKHNNWLACDHATPGNNLFCQWTGASGDTPLPSTPGVNPKKPQYSDVPDCQPCTIGQQCNCGNKIGTCKDIGDDGGLGGCFLNEKPPKSNVSGLAKRCSPSILNSCSPGYTCVGNSSVFGGTGKCVPNSTHNCIKKGDVCGGTINNNCCQNLKCVWKAGNPISAPGTCQVPSTPGPGPGHGPSHKKSGDKLPEWAIVLLSSVGGVLLLSLVVYLYMKM